jgi:hypothetical protein
VTDTPCGKAFLFELATTRVAGGCTTAKRPLLPQRGCDGDCAIRAAGYDLRSLMLAMGDMRGLRRTHGMHLPRLPPHGSQTAALRPVLPGCGSSAPHRVRYYGRCCDGTAIAQHPQRLIIRAHVVSVANNVRVREHKCSCSTLHRALLRHIRSDIGKMCRIDAIPHAAIFDSLHPGIGGR